MTFFEICLIAIGLAMDAFGVSVYKGLVMKTHEGVKKIILPLLFGLFQFFMPLVGWFIGARLSSYVEAYAPWIICLVLVWLGINTIRGAGDEEEGGTSATSWWEMLVLAVATSIDAMAIGLTFAFMKVDVIYASVWIGIITFIIALIGMYLGRFMGSFIEKRAEMLGGVVLILLGVKFLLVGLGII